ncbi:MAG: hypothetical protein IAC13_00230 [Firmicutes bacterium]|uniref:Uncharacterized protein n=1 Tax=Candidatus Scybalomonas excrementavium TaxID=2840943 RepID=A0A9D9HZ77_9FIRM|nr:hypothetical protein [Candidatus Scybalomonas excrementavium]
MRRIGKTTVILLVTASLLTACGNPINKMKANTVYINKEGKVESLSVEDFDKEYYSEDELKQFIDKEVTAQQKERGEGSISLKDFEVKEEKASLKLLYSNTDDYVAFTDTTLEQGDYTKSLLDNKKEFMDLKWIEADTKKEVKEFPEEMEGMKYVVIEDPDGIQLLLDGTVMYYSSQVEFIDKNLIQVPANQKSVILYQEK